MKVVSEQDIKCVIVLDEELPLGMLANTAAILGISLGKLVPECVGADAVDASGRTHRGIVTTPVPVLRSNRDDLKQLRQRLYGEEFRDMIVVDFSDVAQQCNVYDEYLRKAASTSESAHTYYGMALCGRKKAVNKLTGSLPLVR